MSLLDSKIACAPVRSDSEDVAEQEETYLEAISHCERVGRYKDAAKNCEYLAQTYEHYQLYYKARELRDRARGLLGKGPQVVVDLNKLIQQVKDGGIVAVYRCPHCGGKLKIDKGASVESLKVCEHCGSEIETMDLANFLRTALSQSAREH
jgi:DNA-directed RNA polymerase subunit RPC12/RpoP